MKDLGEGWVIFLGLDLSCIYLVPEDFEPDCWCLLVCGSMASMVFCGW